MAGAKALVIGLSAYGGLMSGVDIVSKQVKSTNTFLAEQEHKLHLIAPTHAQLSEKKAVPQLLAVILPCTERGANSR